MCLIGTLPISIWYAKFSLRTLRVETRLNLHYLCVLLRFPKIGLLKPMKKHCFNSKISSWRLLETLSSDSPWEIIFECFSNWASISLRVIQIRHFPIIAIFYQWLVISEPVERLRDALNPEEARLFTVVNNWGEWRNANFKVKSKNGLLFKMPIQEY